MSDYTPADPSLSKGVAGGYAPLDGDANVPPTNLQGPVEFSPQSGGSYTLALEDAGKCVSMDGTGQTLTVPATATVAFAVGTIILIRQAGNGQTTVAAAGGVNLTSRGSIFKTSGQHAWAMLVKVGTDAWELSGDISA